MKKAIISILLCLCLVLTGACSTINSDTEKADTTEIKETQNAVTPDTNANMDTAPENNSDVDTPDTSTTDEKPIQPVEDVPAPTYNEESERAVIVLSDSKMYGALGAETDLTFDYNFHDYSLFDLCAIAVSSDGAYTEGASYDIYKCFLDTPNTVINFLSLINSDDDIEHLCRFITWEVSERDADVKEKVCAFMSDNAQYYTAGNTGKVFSILVEKLEERGININPD